MPTYEYHCTQPNCGKNFEVSAKMSDPAPTQGPGCSREDCCIEKKLSRVSAWVKGGAIAKESAKAAVKDQAILRASGNQGPAVAQISDPNNDPVHVCTKYCSHHSTKAQ